MENLSGKNLSLAFYWHMHQPVYELDGVFLMPWARLHAVKDYLDMVNILEKYPKLKLNINIVPALLDELIQYTKGGFNDIHSSLTVSNIEELARSEKEYILNNFFNSKYETMIYKYPTYRKLFKKRFSSNSITVDNFNNQEFSDLMALFNLSWVDPTHYEKYPELARLAKKGHNYTQKDRIKIIELHKEIIEQNGVHISIDGKAVKSARDKINGGNTPYIVSAFLSDICLSIGQVKVDDKSNEITAIPELINLLDIEGKIITIDAIGTQEDICNLITSKEKKGEYILKVKDNQKDLKDDIKTYFDLGLKRDDSSIAIWETDYEKDHGRIEKRTYYLSYEVNCISDKKKWKSVNAIGRIDVKRIEGNKEKTTKHYYILSKAFDTESFINTTREHWNIECSLHWRLDVILDEDHSRNRIGNSINNLSLIRKIVFNLARLDKSMGEKLTLKQKMTRYTSDFNNIENLIFNVIPYSII